MNRRTRTIALGAVPLLLLTSLMTFDRIPGTDIALTVPYAAEGPGPIFDTLGNYDGKEVVDISGADVDDTSGELNMTTVSVRSNMTLAQALGRWLFTSDTLVPIEQVFPQDMTEDEVREMNVEAFTSSEASATIAAMNYLGLPVGTEVAGIVDESPAHGVLEVGDRIVSINGDKQVTPEQVREKIQGMKPGDDVRVEVQTGAKTHTETITLGENPHEKGQALLGVLMTAVPQGNLDVNYNLEDVGGPSAGMMFSLAVIDKLDEANITGGKTIAGTGTISEDGTVGPIGGITHKVKASEDAGVDVFLAPQRNCEELKGVDSLPIIAVTDISQAIDSLKAFNEGKQYPTCN